MEELTTNDFHFASGVVGKELPELEALCLYQIKELSNDTAALVDITAEGFASMPRLRTLLLKRGTSYSTVVPALTPEALAALFAAIFTAAPALESFEFDDGNVVGEQPRLGNALNHNSPPRSLTRLRLKNLCVEPADFESVELPSLRFLCLGLADAALATFDAVSASLPAGQLKGQACPHWA
ncbi:hypothetical protein T492DRAFT_911809 [Pavlovales sp. CCMP2436]|nr:hypothetical protein T492DRAFT_911809 [Pavlovales sp. CCMP2436]